MLLILGAVPLLLAGAMLAYNQLGKRRMRDLMLGAVPWSGSERVLDVGTGAGLLLTGAAGLTTGGVVGVDIWSAKDLSGNSREQTLRNAAAEGVADRVEVRTADALALPFPDASFDRVLSLLCLHNVAGPDGPQQACWEVARVLRPGGAALIGDYIPTGRYAATLKEAGLVIEQSGPRFGTALSLMWLVVARKPA